MNNREIVDYILNDQLKLDDVIKMTEKDPAYENGESISYITNDGYNLYSDNGPVSLLRFTDGNTEVVLFEANGKTTKYTTTFEIISRRQHQQEVDNKSRQDEIAYLKKRLAELGETIITEEPEPEVEVDTNESVVEEPVEDNTEEDIEEPVEEETDTEEVE